MQKNKPKVIKTFEKLPHKLREQIRNDFANGDTEDLITIPYKNGQLITALPFETEEAFYLIKISEDTAVKLEDLDEDFFEPTENEDIEMEDSEKENQ